MTSWIVIPAFNEASSIGAVVKEILSQTPHVIVVDDGSTDATAAVAQQLPVHYLRHVSNLGQGAALQTGFSYALEQGADIVFSFDADGQMDPRDISRFVDALNDKNIDVALGSRFSEGHQNQIPFFRRQILKIAVWFTRLSTGLPFTDTHNGLRAFRGSALAKIRLKQNGMAHASEIMNQIAENKLRFVEVPVAIKYTEYSLHKGQKSVNLFNILWELFFR